MRYLYGDSAPFPLGYDFLTVLEAFMTAATRIVELDGSIKRTQSEATAAANVRTQGLGSLEVFHVELRRAIDEASAEAHDALTRAYAAQVGDYMNHLVDDQKRTATAQNEADLTQTRAQVEGWRREVQAKLDVLLKVVRLPVQGTVLRLSLDSESKDAHYDVTGVFSCAKDIVTQFRLGTPSTSAWTRPRRVGDVMSGLELRVAVKKSFFGGTVTAETMKLDDWFFSELVLSDESAEIHLRKKPSEKASLVFRRFDRAGRVVVEAEHPQDPNAASLPPELDEDDAAQIDKLLLALQVDVKELFNYKEELLSLTLEGADVIAADRALDLIARLVDLFAPTVIEIARRSPSPHELSLKAESEDGRREERYLRKEELIKKLQPLSAAGRAVFAPLGLDSWVPGVTVHPPPVA